MFYSTTLLTTKGPLGQVWYAIACCGVHMVVAHIKQGCKDR